MTKLIPLRGKDGLGKYAIVDDYDYDLVAGYSWRGAISGNVLYAHTDMLIDGKWRTVRMHRLITQATPSQLIDHKNRDGLDNRRDNLRAATRRENRQNAKQMSDSTYKYKGVRLAKSRYQYQATITVNGKRVALGGYRTQWEAARAYNDAAIKYFGEFAKLNDLPDQPDADDQPLPEPPKSSHYVGVIYDKSRNKWHAAAPKINGKITRLGRFSTQEEAAKARDRYCVEHGLAVRLNFPHA